MDKISTSIQYQLTNVKLINDIFGNFAEFDKVLKAGPNAMKQYLFDQWMDIKALVQNNENVEIKDFDKEVAIDDFDVTFNRTQNGSAIFFFTFPDYEYFDAASKYVALAITKEGIKYFTYEYSKHFDTNQPCWVIGEFYIQDGKINHKNYGTHDEKNLSWFAGFVVGFLETNNL